MGKTVDMNLVDGDTKKDLGALRRVSTVFPDGQRLDGTDMRKANGLSGIPKYFVKMTDLFASVF